jgi:hypothetical protein
MYKILIKILPFVILSILLLGCSHLSGSDNLKLSVQQIKVESWLNLMPGGPGSFHISGEIKIKNSGTCKIDSLNMPKISILQNNKEIYSIVPVFKSKAEGDKQELEREEEKEFVFYTQSGLTIKNELDAGLLIKLILMLTDSDSVFTHEVENVKVEKVY